MFLESLSLRNFRNYAALDIQFDSSGNLFLGGNAQGKTNLLEAIYCLGTARSQRNASDDELIRQGADFFLLGGTGVGGENRRVTVEIRSLRECGRQLRINGSIHRKISDLLGLLPIIDLSPEDVAVVGGAPQQRRHFVNFCISQINSAYWVSLNEYGRILQQRNMALKSCSGRRWRAADSDELEAWARQLVKVGAGIIRKRKEFLKKLGPEVNFFHGTITGGDEQISLAYEPAIELAAEGDIEGRFQTALERLRERELKFGVTLAGPHRDEVVMSINGMNLRTYGSQGQQRTAAIALKLAAARFLEKAKGEQPILLLDDVFAELDGQRTRLLFDLLSEFGQMFIATAKETDLAGCGHNLSKMRVVDGTVTAC